MTAPTPPLILILFALLRSYTMAITFDNICSHNSTFNAQILSAVNLSWPGLEPVRDATEPGEACHYLAAYYRRSNSPAWLRPSHQNRP